MITGYARVSTEDPSLHVQEQAIQAYAKAQGEEYTIYQEKQSGGKADLEELRHALKATQRGNKFVVYKLDRLARSTKQLYEIFDELQKKGAEFISIQDNIDKIGRASCRERVNTKNNEKAMTDKHEWQN